MSMKGKSADRGWAMMSTGIGLLILLIVAVWSMGYYNDYIQQRGWQVTASQLSRFRASVKTYVGRYYDTLLAAASTTVPVIVTPTILKNTGLLEAGFSNTTADGQQISAVVTRNATNTDQLQALVITQGGASLPYTALRNISVDIDGMGGYVWKSTNVTGAMASWSVPLASFGVSTSSGHVGALIPSDELGVAREESDRLYRFSVTGKPDLNRMHTNIDMGSNNLNNTNTVNAQTGNFSGNVTAGGDIRSNGGWLISRGSNGWLNETHGGGFTMTDNDWVRAINNKNIYTGGQVRGGSVRSDSNLSGGGVLQLDQVNAAGAPCSRNGDISHDASGGILSCKDGVWVASGGESTNINIYQCPYSICDNNSASTCGGQLSTHSYCQCRTGGGAMTCGYVGKLLVGY
ncbi:shufflon system plasmid conjugative transfer pilus tip adhesin PilV [Prodigiosinella confusarubida]|uniref:Shufflon system plasmid conjugative transfer pilus tip adhesin PilV n=2 Tax=Serratia sp. (strain ATCC 39006) TaxID=104623 RepID=A0A2I5TBG0_SERS3|nr:shufflon system plasmid conjugative transfer pilus tip adhesin PilV [Serratia sp. ATCC 39006]AUH01894.1 shufflon system plasmid conjugative transfer pilus tip adhesin PilV [Serratia sp. ATCC 39006]AUH06216.1 shufflon system plasmid conjugative transfer pilus tip adhesin PilV [Serratia sp. ATCC 39006]